MERTCKVCHEVKPAELFRSSLTCYECYKSQMRDRHNATYIIKRQTKISNMNTFELIEGHSAIGEFYVQLRSIRIVEKRTGKIVPKFIVWERIGRAVNHEYQMIVEQCHPDYEFYRFDDKSLIGRATI